MVDYSSHLAEAFGLIASGVFSAEVGKAATRALVTTVIDAFTKDKSNKRLQEQLESEPNNEALKAEFNEKLQQFLIENPDITKQLFQQVANSISVGSVYVEKGSVVQGSQVGSLNQTFNE